MNRIVPICILFSLEAFLFANWIPRIPEFMEMLELSEASLGWCLLAAPFGTLFGFPLAGKLSNALGAGKAACFAMVGYAAAFCALGFTSSVTFFVVALWFAGFTIAFVEVGMNAKADEIGRDGRGTIMSRCHGSWSVGTIIGAFIGGFAGREGISLEVHFLIAAIVGAILAIVLIRFLPSDQKSSAKNADEREPIFAFPTRALALLCLMTVGIMLVEGIMIDWSALFMVQTFDADPLEAGLFYGIFASAMAITRFSGDWLTEKFGAKRIVFWSGICAALGISLFGLSTTSLMAAIGCIFAGIGVAIVYPLAMTAAGGRGGRSPAENVASVALVAFFAFLFAPPFIGFIAELSSLGTAFLIIAPLGLLTAALSREAEDKNGPI